MRGKIAWIAIAAALAVGALGCGPDAAEEAQTRHEMTQSEHRESVEKEAGEVEGVIKQRQAEETADALERATG